MLNKLFESFSEKNILVVGDVMVDAYLYGNVSRISPEAPVPIVDISERIYRLGGAANVALNLKSLGANPYLCSVVGNDEKGNLILELMREKGLFTQAIVHSDDRRTTLKYRIIGNKSQMLRVDDEDQNPLSDGEQEAFLQTIYKLLENNKIDAIIFEDYDKGVLTSTNIDTIVKWATQRDIVVAVDPKKRNFNHYQGVTLFKPNLKELKEGVHCEEIVPSLETIQQMMKGFAQNNHIHYLFTTLSEKGVAMYDRVRDQFYHYPAYFRKISDVSGAGDTVIAVSTLCILAGIPTELTAQIANLSGGIVCEYAGVVPVSLSQLKAEIEKNKLL